MRKFILLGCIASGISLNAQVRAGFESNSQYYKDDKKIKIDEVDAENRFRSNNYLKIDYASKYFEVGVQGEGYLPKALLNLNPELEGIHIGTVYARYNNYDKGIDITAGHFYEQFGSGLALRFWEDRALGLNNSLFGGRVKLNMNDYAQLTFLGGRQRLGFGFDLSKGAVYGADAQINLSNIYDSEDHSLNVGMSYVGRYEDLTIDYPLAPKTTDVLAARLDYSGEKFHFNAEYAYKSPDMRVESRILMDDTSDYGNALLVNLGYNNEGFAVNANLRRLENFSFFSERKLAGNVYNIGSVNYIPALTKQYDHALQNIFVYQAQPNYINSFIKKKGEIGGQFDMFYEIPTETFFGGQQGGSLTINGSYWAGLKFEEQGADLISNNFFDFGQKYYSDIALEYRSKFTDNFLGIFSYLNQYYNKQFVEDSMGEVNAHTVVLDGTYFLSETKSVRLELQHQWADYDRKNWAGGTLEFTPNPTWSFFLHDIYNYGNDDPDMQIHYYSIGGAFSKGATRIAASYGRQRGGIMCVGGVCRYVPESAGLSLGITTNF